MVHQRALSPVLIGRQEELRVLGERFSLTANGHGGLLLIAGDAGVGKTRLLHEFVRRVREEGPVEILEGFCSESDTAVPLGPVVQALRGWLRLRGPEVLLRTAGPWKSDIVRLLPELGPPVTEDLGGEANPNLVRRRLFEAIRQVLQPGPTEAVRLAILEDLHWSDLTSMELVQFLARVVQDDRLLILGTYRQDELHRRHPLTHWLAQLDHDGLADTLTLRELVREDVDEMLSAILARRVPALFTDAIHRRTRGNPFFLEEILKSLLATHTVERLLEAGEHGIVRQHLAMPLSVKDTVLARTADLDEKTRRVLTYAAVIGPEFDLELLLELTEMSEADLVQSVSILVDRQLVVEDASNGQDRFVFRHALTREVIYQTILGREKRRLHQQVLSAMEALHPDRSEEAVDQLAYHSLQAHELDKAARYSWLAGERAERMRAFPEARQSYELVLELTESGGPEDKARLLDRLGTVALALGDGQVAFRYWKEARALLVELGDPPRVADMERKLSGAAWAAGDTEGAFTHARAAIEILEGGPPCVELAMAYSTLSQRFMVSSSASDAIEWGNKALAIARDLGDQRTKSHALNNIGSALAHLGRIEEGVSLLEESLEIAEAAELPDDVQRACNNLADVLVDNGETSRALGVLQRALNIAQAAGNVIWIAHLSGHLAGLRLGMAEWGEAEEHLLRLRKTAPDYVPGRLMGIVNQAFMQMERDQVQEALGLLIESQGLFEQYQEHHAGFHVGLGECLQRLGRRAEAKEALHLAAQTWAKRGLDVGSIGEMGRALMVYLELGEESKAADLLAAVERAHQERSNPWTRAVRNGSMGLIAKHRGESTNAVDHFTVSIAEWARMQITYVEALDRRDRAQCLLQSSDPADMSLAEEDLIQARQVFERTGAAYQLGLVTKLEDLLPGVAPAPEGTQSPFDSLTPREREVLALVARGLTNREIAKELVISLKTAEIHVGNILGKMGLNSRTQAAALALQRGLADPGGPDAAKS